MADAENQDPTPTPPSPSPTPSPTPTTRSEPPAPPPEPPADWKHGAAAWRLELDRRDASRRAKEAERAAAEIRAQADAELAAARRALEDQAMATAMVQMGGDFAHGSVQRFFRDQYRAVVAEAGDAAPSFSDWLADDATRSDPLYSRFFAQPEAAPTAPPPVQAAASAAPPAQPPPNPDRGTTDAAGGDPGEVTDQHIASWAKNAATWRQNQAKAQKALERRLGVSLSPSSAKD